LLGIGLEAVATVRFRRVAERFGERLRQRLFTPSEQAYAAKRRHGVESLAVRLAAKLAARRALNAGALRWQEVEVVRERGQAPTLRFHGEAARCAAQRGVRRIVLTLTHDPSYCIAQVMLESDP